MWWRLIAATFMALAWVNAVAEETIKVGLILPMTGPFTTTGKQVEAGARFWGHHARMRYAEAFEVPRFVWDIARGTAAVRRVEKAQPTALRLPLAAGIRR